MMYNLLLVDLQDDVVEFRQSVHLWSARWQRFRLTGCRLLERPATHLAGPQGCDTEVGATGDLRRRAL